MFKLSGLFKKKQNIFYEYFLLIAKNIVLASNTFMEQMQHLEGIIMRNS